MQLKTATLAEIQQAAEEAVANAKGDVSLVAAIEQVTIGWMDEGSREVERVASQLINQQDGRL